MAKNGKHKLGSVREITDNTVFLKDRTCLAVFEIAPIDFDRMGERKKQEVMAKYRGWIESLDYPVQIAAINVNLDFAEQAKILKNKIEHSIKQKQEYRDMMNLFKEFEEWFDSYAARNSSHRKIYYLVVPYTGIEQPTMLDRISKSKSAAKHEAALSLLNERAEECVKRLSATGVRAYRLTTSQLENLYWQYSNINNQKGAGADSVFIGAEEWFRMWKDDMESKE